jgi:hypothetical protein
MVLCLVLELGADVNIEDDNGLTPLHIAANGNIDMVRCLLNDLNSYVDKEHNSGATASLVAAEAGHFTVMRCLICEHGADINHTNHFGETALIIASASKHVPLAKWLVKAGADPQADNAGNQTAADISRLVGASPEQTAYLKAKTHCVNPSCSGAVPGLHAGEVLRRSLPFGALACARVRVPAAGRRAQKYTEEGWGRIRRDLQTCLVLFDLNHRQLLVFHYNIAWGGLPYSSIAYL